MPETAPLPARVKLVVVIVAAFIALLKVAVITVFTATSVALFNGEVLVTVGAVAVKVKVSALVAVPPGVVTETVPVVPLPTTAVTWVAETTVTSVAAVPPMLTAVAPVRLVPLMVTEAPVPPEVGVKPVIVGAAIKVKLSVLVAVPPGVVTETVPVVPLPTLAVTWVAETTVTSVAAVPPMLTAVAPVRLVPLMVTEVPVTPDAGVNELIVGAAAGTVKFKVVVAPDSKTNV